MPNWGVHKKPSSLGHQIPGDSYQSPPDRGDSRSVTSSFFQTSGTKLNDLSFLVSHCILISGFLLCRLSWHPPTPGHSVFLRCAAPLGPSPVLADLDKENLSPTSTPCLCSQPFFHLLVPQPQGTLFAIITCSYRVPGQREVVSLLEQLKQSKLP